MSEEKLRSVIKNSNIRKVLLMGYNGANNTGSEARLLTIIKDVQRVLGPEVQITVPTMFKDNLRRYIKEEPGLKIADYPPVYFSALRRLVQEHDLILLTEGSCYMDTWSFYLLWAFLWVSWCAFKNRKPVVAYAVDSGTLSALNRKLVRKVASKTNLIITRTQAAAECLKDLDVSAPVVVTADSAFNFHPEAADRDILKRIWPEAASGVIGIAAVDFYLWPVVFRLWGDQKNYYRWPFYYSDSPERRSDREKLAMGFASFADRTIEKYRRPLALICMEGLDEPFAKLIQSSMRHAKEIRIFSSREYNASQMTAILRSLDLLITSRYHAGVLSLDAAVPQIAIGHDQRLCSLYRDLEIYDEYFLDYNAPGLFQLLEERVDNLLQNPVSQQHALRKNNQIQRRRAECNAELLTEFLNKAVWESSEVTYNGQPGEVIT